MATIHLTVTEDLCITLKLYEMGTAQVKVLHVGAHMHRALSFRIQNHARCTLGAYSPDFTRRYFCNGSTGSKETVTTEHRAGAQVSGEHLSFGN